MNGLNLRAMQWIAGLVAGCLMSAVAGPARAQPTVAPAPQSPAQEPALTPLEIKAVPTITCIGVEWDVRGDSNANATGALEYRQAGESDWKIAFPLHRSPARPAEAARFQGGFKQYADRHLNDNYLAGSVIGLKPDTKYELRVTLNDPDGGGASKTLSVATRPVPVVPRDGRVVEVRGGGAALKQAAEAAQPGDVLFVHAGKYDGGIVVEAKGTAEKPVCIAAAGDGEVLLDGGDAPKGPLMGIRVTGTFVRIQGLSFYNFQECVRGDPSAVNLAVMRCKMDHFFTAVYSRANDGYFADNTIRESFNALDPAVDPGERNEGHGIHLSTETSGAVVCYNAVSLVADGVRLWGRDSDCIGNDVIFNVDDGIELDAGGPNLRVVDNRWSFTGQNGISFQPYIGGPAFIVRNLVIGDKENAIKNRYSSEAGVFVNNTLICFDGSANDLPYGSYTRNNLLITIPGKGRSSARVNTSKERLAALDMDYDGIGPMGINEISVKDFTAQTGLEKHGIPFDSDEEVLAKVPGPFPQYMSQQWTVPEAFLKDMTRPHPDLSLKAGSKAIGAGIAIPNLMERADGKAPDLGAWQFGQPIPHYGPRP
jgi:hypothetical protein